MAKSRSSQADSLDRGYPITIPFVKYHKISTIVYPDEISKLKDREVEVYEKLDGGNCQVRRVGEWAFLGGNKSNFLRGKKILKKRKWFERFNGWIYSNQESLSKLPCNVILFGEWLGNHTIKYNKENENQFYLIDAYDLSDKVFWPYEKGAEIVKILHIDPIRLLKPLFKGKVNKESLEKLLIEQPSDYYNGPKEGVVIKDYKEQKFWRMYHPDFAECRLEPDGARNFLTHARFRKTLYKIVEEKGNEDIGDEELAQFVHKEIKEDEDIEIGLNKIKEKIRLFRTGHKL